MGGFPAAQGYLNVSVSRSSALLIGWLSVECTWDTALLTFFFCLASDSRVQACAAVWRMPKELESGSHESPEDPASTAQTLELLCHLDNGAQGNVAW